MKARLHELELVEIARAADASSDRHAAWRATVRFLDLVVDGVPLRTLVPMTGNMLTELKRSSSPSVTDAVEVLLARRQHAELPVGRVPLLVCEICGDLGCGALTARLEVDQDSVRWSTWQWEDGRSPPMPVAGAPGGLLFERGAYEGLLLTAADRVAALPLEESTERRQRPVRGWRRGGRQPRA